MSDLRLPNPLARPRGRAIFAMVMLGVLQAACLFLAALSTRGLFEALHGSADVPFMLVGLLCFSAAATATCNALARTKAEAIGHSFAIELREVVFSAIARLPQKVRNRRSVGGLSLRFVGDMTAARGWVGLGVHRLIVGALVAPAAFTCLWWLDPRLAAAGALPLLAAVLLMVGLGTILRRRHRRLRKSRAKLAIFAMERIMMSDALTRLGRLRRELKSLKKEGRAVADNSVSRIRRVSLLRALPDAGLGFGGAAILWTALNFEVAPGTTAGALAVLGIAALPIKEMIGVWDRYVAWSVARARCEALLASTEEEPSRSSVDAPMSLWLKKDGDLRFYCPAGQVTGLSILEIDDAVDAMHCIVSGSETSGWAAEFDGESGSTLQVGFVNDDPSLLKGSLRRNLSLGCKRRPSDHEIEDCARANGLGSLMDRLGGLDGTVTERGTNLTATEKLRISVVQVILAEPVCIVIQSYVWSHLADRDRLLPNLGNNGATIVHTLGAKEAPGTEVWLSDGCSDLKRAASHGIVEGDNRKCA